MSDTQFTPGPWRYFKQGDSTRFHVTSRPSTHPGNGFEDFAQVDIAHEADARLIAAAPDLYEALVEVLAAERFSKRPPHSVAQAHTKLDRIRSAVAKAEAALAKARI